MASPTSQPSPDPRHSGLRAFAERSKAILLVAAVVGVLTGLGVAGFDSVVNRGVDAVERAPLWVTAVAPTIGLAVAALCLRFVGKGCSPSTADEYLRAFHDPAVEIEPRPIVARMLGGIATLASGVPMGLEGPSLYLGAGIGDLVQRRFPTLASERNRRALLVAGAAAGVAAIFKAPATGAVFALEVPYQDDLARRMLGPALVGAATSYLVFVAIHGTTPLVTVTGTPNFSFRDLAAALLLGLFAGFGARVFAWMLRAAKRLAISYPDWLRVPLAGGVLVALFVLARVLTGTDVTTGPGYGTIAWALDPRHGAWLVFAVLLLRLVGTSTAVAGGGVGGLFVPLVVAGALAGRVTGGAFGLLDTTLFTVVGVAAFLGAGYRVPLAAVTFVAEVSGRPGFIVPGLLAAVVADLVMGDRSVTAYQRAADSLAPPSTDQPESPG